MSGADKPLRGLIADEVKHITATILRHVIPFVSYSGESPRVQQLMVVGRTRTHTDTQTRISIEIRTETSRLGGLH